MTYFPDLAPYDYLPDTVPEGVELLTVGWLEPGREFAVSEGDPDPLFWDNLVALAADHTVAVTRSVHACRFRHLFEADYQYRAVYGTRVLYLGSAEIRVVAADGRQLTAPTLVVHYVRDHGYQPPAEFVEAVAAMRVAPCPAPE
ncbi:hypothetical protein ABIA35_001666 [Catenulispora sp. MAP12-49]|uniref:DUF7919 family protein n=1 Tax=unclassified Catenulispora TaxID=414885 RepID=UPI003512110D